MNLYFETTAMKGASEVGSILLRYVMNNFAVLNENEERNLIIWSDRSAGQNNNWQLLCLFNQIIHLGYFTSITQKFLVSGHSFMLCDSHFARIEATMKRFPNITPLIYEEIFREASKTNPFHYILLEQQDFYDLNPLKRYLRRPSTLLISRNLIYRLSAANLNIVQSKINHSEENWVDHFIRFNGRLINIATQPRITDSPGYGARIELSLAKQYSVHQYFHFLEQHERDWYAQHVGYPPPPPPVENAEEIVVD